MQIREPRSPTTVSLNTTRKLIVVAGDRPPQARAPAHLFLLPTRLVTHYILQPRGTSRSSKATSPSPPQAAHRPERSPPHPPLLSSQGQLILLSQLRFLLGEAFMSLSSKRAPLPILQHSVPFTAPISSVFLLLILLPPPSIRGHMPLRGSRELLQTQSPAVSRM